MTTPQNPAVVKLEGPVTNYAIDPTVTFNPGDLIEWDAVNLLAIVMASASDYAQFLGVAVGQNPIASGIDNAMQSASNSLLAVQGSGIAMLISTNSETYKHGLAVKFSAAQKIALDGGAGQVIGYVYLPDGSTIAGDGTVRVPVRLKRNLPNQLP